MDMYVGKKERKKEREIKCSKERDYKRNKTDIERLVGCLGFKAYQPL